MSGALIGTGEFRQHDFMRRIWDENTDTRRQGIPRLNVVRIAVGCEFAHKIDAFGSNVMLSGNLGHVGALISGEKKHLMCGWSASVMALAMIAYCDDSDFIYKEQDCLAFGPWIDQMYADMGNKNMVFGRAMKTSPFMPCSQSLFLVRHKFIPEFVKDYIYLGDESSKDNLPEHKFVKLESMSPSNYGRLSFGYDRERPIDYSDNVFFAQKLSPEELKELAERRLI